MDEETAVVGDYPDCDIHSKMFGTRVPAAYDAATNLPNGLWAYMCADCFPKWGPGQLGLGRGQRLVLATEHDKTDYGLGESR